MSAAHIRAVEEKGEVILDAGGTPVKIVKEDLDIVREDLKGWLVESENGCTVALDVELTPELVEEGLAREFVNRVQNMRKDAGFDVTDRIRIFASGRETLNRVLRQLGPYIRNETLAVDITDGTGKGGGYTAQWDINGEQCTITIEKVGSNGSPAPGR
jgi:isoleucyl-tRNA synthetase